MSKKAKVMFALGAALAAGGSSGRAEAMSCSFSAVSGVSFGGYNVFSSASLDSTGSVSIVCHGIGAGDALTIDLSRGGASSYFPRSLSGGSGALSYNLFLDAARTVVWGDGTTGTGHFGPVTPGEGVTATATIYGRIPARQNAAVGVYADTITVTINF